MTYKFLFINAIDPSKDVETKYPPLGLGYLISSLRKQFGEKTIDFKIIDCNVEQEIINFKPDIVGISAVSQNYNRAIEYAGIAKKHEVPVICGGVHITMAPYSLSKDMDIGVMGEGEETVCELFELFRRKGKFDRNYLSNIKGIIYRNEKNEIVFTGERKLIKPLDAIPFPARDLFEIKPHTYMFTSRGCPYRCAFCASSRFWKKVRFFSAEYVVNEIQYLVNEFNVTDINFQDDLFSADKKRLKKIIYLLDQRNLLGKLSFSGAIRANMVNEEIMELFRKMGVTSLGVGFESGCNETLKYLKGENIDVKDNENAVRLIKKYGIALHGSFIIGSPREKKEDILQTLEFIKKNKISKFAVYVLIPFPGTEVWDYAVSRGLVDDNMDWDKLNVDFIANYENAIILSEELSREEILKLFLRFRLFLRYQQYRKPEAFYNLIKKALLNPWKVPGYLVKKIRKYWRAV